MNATASGIRVRYIQTPVPAGWSSAKTKNIPASAARESRPDNPTRCCSDVSAISTRTDTVPRAVKISTTPASSGAGDPPGAAHPADIATAHATAVAMKREHTLDTQGME